MGHLIYHYSLDHVRALRERARRYHLWHPEGFAAAPDELIRRCYNGIGPDRWASQFRGLVTWLLGFFEADAMLHDFEYSLPGKTYGRFTLANVRFCVNAVLLALQAYPLKLAVKVAALGVLLGVLCQLFGYSGYKTGTIPEEEK